MFGSRRIPSMDELKPRMGTIIVREERVSEIRNVLKEERIEECEFGSGPLPNNEYCIAVELNYGQTIDGILYKHRVVI